MISEKLPAVEHYPDPDWTQHMNLDFIKPWNPNESERGKKRQLEFISNVALQDAFRVYHYLGEEGKEPINGKNQFGDQPIKADFFSELAIINIFKLHKAPVRFLSEEHGMVDITKAPEYLFVMDGIDGSDVLKFPERRNNKDYGTMLAGFSNLNPKYDDVLYGGIMMHRTKELYFTQNGRSFRQKNKQRLAIPMRCSPKTEPDAAKLYIGEDYDKAFGTHIFDNFNSLFPGCTIDTGGSTAGHLKAMLDKKVDATVELTRKGNLEHPTVHALITNARGATRCIDDHGEISPLGEQLFMSFGQDLPKPGHSLLTRNLQLNPRFIITAGTSEMAEEIAQRIRFGLS